MGGLRFTFFLRGCEGSLGFDRASSKFRKFIGKLSYTHSTCSLPIDLCKKDPQKFGGFKYSLYICIVI